MNVKLLGGPLHGREYVFNGEAHSAVVFPTFTIDGGFDQATYRLLIPGVYCWDGWTLPAVLEWFAGKPCPTCVNFICDKCYADPPAEFGRDVLVAFLRSGGWKHETAQGWADTIEAWTKHDKITGHVRPPLEIKRLLLRHFSGPPENGGVRILVNRHLVTPEQLLPPLAQWQAEPANPGRCTNSERPGGSHWPRLDGKECWCGALVFGSEGVTMRRKEGVSIDDAVKEAFAVVEKFPNLKVEFAEEWAAEPAGLDIGKEPDRTVVTVAKKPKLKLLTTAESEALEKKPETWRDRPPLL